MSQSAFQQFMLEYPQAADKEKFRAEFCKQYPQLASWIDNYLKMKDALAPPPAPAEQAMPTQLGEFILGPCLGRSMGEVYEAWQPSLERHVVVKVIRRGVTGPEAVSRFDRERQVLARVQHTNIVPIFAGGEDGGIQYCVMRHIDGAALDTIIHTTQTLCEGEGNTPPLSELAQRVADPSTSESSKFAAPTTLTPSAATAKSMQAVTVNVPLADKRVTLSQAYFESVARAMADIAAAVDFAHERGVIHRDIKPGNLIVEPSGHTWLIDFGLADSDAPPGETQVSAPPMVSGVMGTPAYMSPEQYASRADQRSDVYGLGVTMYELLTLRPAFSGTSREELKEAIEAGNSTRPRKLANVPTDLEAICLKAMHVEPSQRYASAKEMAKDLRRWLAKEVTRARPKLHLYPWRWAQRKPGLAVAVSMVLLVVGIGATWGATEANARVQRRERELRVQTERSERDLVMLRLQQARMGDRVAEWSEEVKKHAKVAARAGPSVELRSQAAAGLLGLDAEVIKKQKGGASSLAFDKKGKRLLRGGREGEASSIYDIDADRETKFEQVGPGPVAFLDDEPVQLVSSKGQWPVRLWDLKKNRSIRDLTPPEKERRPLRGMALSADASVAATVQEEEKGKRTVHVWDLRTGKIFHSFEQTSVTSLALSPDGAELAVGQEDGRITFGDQKGVKQPLPAGRLPVYSLVFGRDPHEVRTGRKWQLAAGDGGGSVRIWDLSIGQVRVRCFGASHHVYSLAFSPDGTTLASAGRAPTILWDVATGRRLLITRDSPDYVGAVAFSPSGDRLAASSAIDMDGMTFNIVWALTNRSEIQHLRGLVAPIARVRFSRDGKRLVALAHDWDVGVWDLEKGHLLHVLAAPRGLLTDNVDVNFSPDGKQLAFCSSEEATLWDVSSGKQVARWVMPPGMVNRLLFDERGVLFVCRVETKDAKRLPLPQPAPPDKHPRVCRFYELRANKERRLLAENNDFAWHVSGNEAAPNGAGFVLEGLGTVKGKERAIIAFSPAGKKLWSIDLPQKKQPGAKILIDPTGKQVAVYLTDQPTVTLVTMATGKVETALEGNLCAFGPGADRQLNWPQAPIGHWSRFAYSLRGEKNPILQLGIDQRPAQGSACFNSAGSHVTWGNEDGTVVVCDLPAVQRALAKIGLGWE